MKDKNTILKKDLDEIQSVLEEIQKDDDEFVVICNEGGEPSVSVYKSVNINRICDEYLIINMFHNEDKSSMTEIEFTCLKDGEEPEGDPEPIEVTDIHIWALNYLGQGELIYPKIDDSTSESDIQDDAEKRFDEFLEIAKWIREEKPVMAPGTIVNLTHECRAVLQSLGHVVSLGPEKKE